jgi:hypothetical protein
MAIFLVAGAVLYFLPTLIAALRGHGQFRVIFMRNLLFGWSPLDWALALGKACSASYRPARPPLS